MCGDGFAPFLGTQLEQYVVGVSFSDSYLPENYNLSLCQIGESLRIEQWQLRGIPLAPHEYDEQGLDN